MLQGAGTRFTAWFYAMIHLLRMRNAFLATIHQERFCLLDLNDHVRYSIIDIKDKIFWKEFYTILCAVCQEICILFLYDLNTPAMDKIFCLYHCTSNTIAQSMTALNDIILFGPLSASDGLGLEETKVYGVANGVTTGLAVRVDT